MVEREAGYEAARSVTFCNLFDALTPTLRARKNPPSRSRAGVLRSVIVLIPKTGLTNATIPTLMDFSEVICPAERRALREIVETAEVVREGDHL